MKLIASEIANRLDYLREIYKLNNSLTALQTEHRGMAADIREPISGIANILDVILDSAASVAMELSFLQE